MSRAVVRLSRLLSEHDERRVSVFLRSFRCSRDSDLEAFLHDKAVMYEKRGRSRTYLIVDTDDGNRIVAYVSLALTVVTVSGGSELSNSVRRRMDLHNGIAPSYLVGQLAKDDSVSDKMGGYLMDVAMTLIRGCCLQIGCRTVCVDCKDPLVPYYEDKGFRIVERSSESPNGLNRMVVLVSPDLFS